MQAGIDEVLMIVTPRDKQAFKRLLGDGSDFGIQISYAFQETPRGLADAFIIGEKFIGSETVCLILGDNLFHGDTFAQNLARNSKLNGGKVFASQVKDPQRYGVIEFDSHGKAISIEEKPKTPKSQFAIPGIYFFDNQVTDIAKYVKPSARGELEITSILNSYLESNKLNVEVLPKGTAWLDTGTAESLHDASSYVRVLEERQGYKIGCPEEIGLENGWIGISDIKHIIQRYGRTEYAQYLQKLVE